MYQGVGTVSGLGAADVGAAFNKCYATERTRCVRRYGNTLAGFACTRQQILPCYAYAASHARHAQPRARVESQAGLGEYGGACRGSAKV